MHEASIAYELLNIAVNECSKNGYSKIETIKVVIGRATGVVPQALLFAFNVLKEDTIAKNANLIIEEAPVKGFCKDCKNEFENDENYILFECPNCGSFSINLISGKELNIKEMEVS
ncbi:MAG: hydrogenase maturation nickel metallochaperone HypA [Thermodesulfovibrio sp.]|jgi:hydrogenase nickel incorporation protein HypA/HybF|uniref:hydrogenase maturation nickel metallochaperone HypA n=1 Tax=unclassified Thermodesulfovibrio TaxID=2645936 RepID=UPI000839EC85|nr:MULTISPECIES: hydrogenase maturation nickel metallochaperone HypA [unclassified Thermodesulfovibrio]MDI1472528.1 hydrogenase maturation nickel metallochaperone HypA [Thermodesulfovibrio sp. 1176]MDI6714435.1 hydrogenase maturation nickel metallochaperone HypA [Thermodesulfovibrio sp.]ODA44863.1 [NiFe] hydrogenase nickel incorporation protein HypA [Thermodesulfovibrio sp. N1]